MKTDLREILETVSRNPESLNQLRCGGSVVFCHLATIVECFDGATQEEFQSWLEHSGLDNEDFRIAKSLYLDFLRARHVL